MSAGQIAAPHWRLGTPIVVGLVVGAFAFGGLAGFSLPRAAGSSHVDAAAGSAAGAVIPGVAVNNMSDAADRAFAGLSAHARTIPGAAVNNMSDAAERAFAGLSAGAVIPGVAVNNMSDAADRAFAGLAAGARTIPGVAVNNMSDAADRAFAGLAATDHERAENTFTKWITTPPAMAGVVGGDVGAGSYAGEILKYTPAATTVIEALYHFNGSKHSFTALVHVEQTGLKAVIIGVVTEGWLKGNMVQGEYTQITCVQAPSSTSGTCFQGTLDIMRGSKSKD